jgi:hypothetical protein
VDAGRFSVYLEGMKKMNVVEEHETFIRAHLDNRSGERRGRLERGHGHGEALFAKQIWWVLRGDFEHLHPEYEVLDWRGRSYFADFAWLPGFVKLLIEIKGYTSHVRDLDRQKFCNELNRETFLHAMGYQVISFAYDDVEQKAGAVYSLAANGDGEISSEFNTCFTRTYGRKRSPSSRRSACRADSAEGCGAAF